PALKVWEKAMLPYPESQTALKEIVAGRFEAMTAQLNPGTLIAGGQKRYAREEAALILGEMYVKRRELDDARSAFSIAAKSQYEIALIAKTRLKHLNQN